MLIGRWFGIVGANLQVEDKLLPDSLGRDVRNLQLGFGDFTTWGAANVVHTLPVGPAQSSIYRMGRDAPSDVAYWLSSPNDVDYVRVPLVGDTTERTFYTGESEPRFTNNVIGLAGPPYPSAYRTAGVPAPPAGFSVALGSAGSGATEQRVYLDTFVTDQGEEGPPNPATATISVAGGSTVNISLLAPPPSGPHGINRRRIYVSTSGSEFRRVLEQSSTLTTATDTGVRGDVLPSGGSTSKPAWLAPPSDLRGAIELWNGMIGGFYANTYAVCVAYRPWAWPLEYQRAVPDKIVASGKWGGNWLLLTTGQPRLVTGSSPASLSDQPVPFKHPCVSKRSAVSWTEGTAWASNEGLVSFGMHGPRELTKGTLTPKQWANLNPQSIVGCEFDGYYFGFYNDGARQGFMLDLRDPQGGIVFLDQGATAVFQDSISQRPYLLDTGNVIRKWDTGSKLSGRFLSGIKRHPYRTNPGAALVVASAYPLTFKLFADGALRHTRTVTSNEPFPLPANYLAREFQVEVTGTNSWQGILLGEDFDDIT